MLFQHESTTFMLLADLFSFLCLNDNTRIVFKIVAESPLCANIARNSDKRDIYDM